MKYATNKHLYLRRYLFVAIVSLALLRVQGALLDAPFQFPIKLGSDEWKQRAATENQYSLCQMPVELARGMTTMALIETCLKHPMLVDFELISNVDTAMENFRSQFAGFAELLDRKDLGQNLVSKLKSFDLNALLDGSRVDRPTFIEIRFLLQLISNDKTLDKLSADSLRELCTTTLEIARRIRVAYGKTGSEKPAALLAVKLLMERNVSIPTDDRVLDKTFMPNDATHNLEQLQSSGTVAANIHESTMAMAEYLHLHKLRNNVKP